jgi:hypothetical protein
LTVKVCQKFENENESEKFLAKVELCKIDPRTLCFFGRKQIDLENGFFSGSRLTVQIKLELICIHTLESWETQKYKLIPDTSTPSSSVLDTQKPT